MREGDRWDGQNLVVVLLEFFVLSTAIFGAHLECKEATLARFARYDKLVVACNDDIKERVYRVTRLVLAVDDVRGFCHQFFKALSLLDIATICGFIQEGEARGS